MHDRTSTPTPPPPTVQRADSAVPRSLRRYLSLDDFEATARRRLPKFLYGYISGAAETDAALAAAAMNVPMCLSASSLIKLEDVRRENPAAWYQAYLAGDVARIEPLVDRVADAGYDTFVVTADVPVPPNRENNIRNGFKVPLAITPQVAWDTVTHPHWLFGP